MRRSPTEPLALALLLAAVWALAAWARLLSVEQVSVGSDALGQFLAAWSARWGWWPKPPNPEAGPGLWLLAWPLVHVAGSLHELFGLRLILGALVAPLGAASAWLLASRGRLAAATGAGVLLALDPGLIDTLLVAFRGYGAPELVGTATLGLALALRDRPWGLLLAAPALVWAADQHPMAAGVLVTAPAWALLVPGARRWTLAALALGLVVALPHLAWLAHLAGCGAGPVACLTGVATGSAEPDTALSEMLRRAFHDRCVVEHGWVSLLLGAGLLLSALQPRARRALAWLGLASLGVVLLGLSVHSLRPYHLRIVAVPLAVLASVGLARWWPLPLLLALAASWRFSPVTGPDPGGAERADRAAQLIATVPAPLRVDGVWMDRPEGIEPAAVVLSAVLQGQDPDRFEVVEGARVVLLLNGVDLPLEQRVRVFEDQDAARTWLCGRHPARVGGAFDWMAALHPRRAELGATAWDPPPSR